LVRDELEDTDFFKKYINSIPEVIQSSIQNPDQIGSKDINYIIKERIDGNDLESLYAFGCFLEPDELKNKNSIETCKKMTENSTGRELLDGLKTLLEEIKNFDNHHTGFLIGDLHGNNILWDKNHKKMVIIDFSKSASMERTSLEIFGQYYNEGRVFYDKNFKNNPENLKIPGIKNSSKSKGCLEKQKVQNLLREYISIEENNDISKLNCSTFR
jgi:hypothetical protein